VTASVLQERETSINSGTGGNITLAFSSNITLGSIIHAIATQGDSSASTYNFTDNNGGLYIPADTCWSTNHGQGCGQSAAINHPAGATSVTITYPGVGAFPGLAIKEIGGVQTLEITALNAGTPGEATSAVNSIATGGANTAASGSSFVVFAATSASGFAATPITDNKGNAFTPVTALGSGLAVVGQIFYCQNGVGGSGHVFTAHNPTGTNTVMSIWAVEIQNGSLTGVLDQFANGLDDATSPFTSNTTPTTTQSSELVLAFMYDNRTSANAPVWGNGYTQLQDVSNTAGITGGCAALNVRNEGAQQSSFTAGSSGITEAVSFIATFKGAQSPIDGHAAALVATATSGSVSATNGNQPALISSWGNDPHDAQIPGIGGSGFSAGINGWNYGGAGPTCYTSASKRITSTGSQTATSTLGSADDILLGLMIFGEAPPTGVITPNPGALTVQGNAPLVAVPIMPPAGAIAFTGIPSPPQIGTHGTLGDFDPTLLLKGWF